MEMDAGIKVAALVIMSSASPKTVELSIVQSRSSGLLVRRPSRRIFDCCHALDLTHFAEDNTSAPRRSPKVNEVKSKDEITSTMRED